MYRDPHLTPGIRFAVTILMTEEHVITLGIRLRKLSMLNCVRKYRVFVPLHALQFIINFVWQDELVP